MLVLYVPLLSVLPLWLPALGAADLTNSAQQTSPARQAVSAEHTIPLWPEGVPGAKDPHGPEQVVDGRVSNVHEPTLTVFPASPAPGGSSSGTAVIICPGGGYVRLSMVGEGTDPARWLNARGVAAFVLKYRLVEYGHPAPLQDVLRAIRLVRSHAAEFRVRPDRIGVMGFSAGGHLAGSAATLYDAPEGRTGGALDAVSARPDFVALLYPVITMKAPFAHAGSRRSLLGESPSPETIEHLSVENQVTKDTSPAFIIHTEEDATVPVENSLMFYQALRRAAVSTEMHLYQKGPHGLGMRTDLGPVSDWPHRLEEWMRFHGWL